MTTVDDSTQGGPKLPRKADLIFDTALRHLADRGYDALTIEGIAAESGVNKTTLYRWWSGKDTLVSDALRHGGLLELRVPDTGSLRGDLIDTLRQVAGLLGSPHTRAIIAGAIDDSRPGLVPLATDFVGDRLAGHERILDRAKARGEIGDTATGAEVFHPLMGALWIKVLLLHQSASDAYLANLVDNALNGFLSPPHR